MANDHWIREWTPDDEDFWRSNGRAVARRNLIWSIFAQHLGFGIWTLWSVVTVKLGAWKFSTDQLFWLIALPSLVGGVARFPYTFAPAKFGGRNWTVVATLLLLVPAGLFAMAVANPATPYWAFLLISATAGLGGGVFASSMANITYFYPERRQGTALGLNAAGGNIGVSSVQLLIPLVIGAVGLTAAGLVWIPLILLAAVAAYFFMDNLSTARSTFTEQARVAGRMQTWVMSLLYIGTFGSFIGYATALPLLTESQFTGVSGTRYSFLGALVGSLARPVGGWLADRLGGARVTLWTFLAMGAGVALAGQGIAIGSFPLFLGAFLVLFVSAGVGNGSTFRMIPAIFKAKSLEGVSETDPVALKAALAAAKREAAAAIGIASAVGALGGFLINRGFGMSIAATHGAGAALTAFAVFYALCLVLTWWCYLRRRVAIRIVPSLGHANV